MLIQNHPFMQKKGCEFMRLDTTQLPHQIVEKILLNVAARNSMTWKELLNTDYYDTDTFAEACVAVILVNKYLFATIDDDRFVNYPVLGFKHYDVIDEYYKAIR